MSNADQPTQFQIDKIEVDGRDIKGLLVELDYFESIYIPATGGSMTIMDSSKAKFIEENNIGYVLKDLSDHEYRHAILKIKELYKIYGKVGLKLKIRDVARRYRSFDIAHSVYTSIYS